MLPSDVVYDQIPKTPYLVGKLEMGEFTYTGPNAAGNSIVFANFGSAVEMALSKGKFIAVGGKAAYRISGTIKDVATPSCVWGSCEGGATIEYTLTDLKTASEVHTDLLVVPYTAECPVMMDNALPWIMKTYTESIGANVAQLIQVISRLQKTDLQ